MVKWESGRRSENVEDRRSRGPARASLGVGGTILILLAVLICSGGDLGLVLRVALQMQGGGGGAPQRAPDPEEDRIAEFVSVMLADTEDVWTEQFRKLGKEYRKPTLVLFRGSVQSACGVAGASVGPFYCPADEKLYIDLSFYQELSDRFGAPGDFAQAYVIAHEVGHHVQNLLGITDRIQTQRERLSKADYNELSVRLELQADFLAGVWAHHAQRQRHILEAGDVEEGLRAAAAIGDDTLQKRSQGYAVPESFTHGTSEQRVRWFRRGFETGDLSQMDTFGASRL